MTSRVAKIKKNKVVVGIDASNLLSGGGLTYLVELLRHASPEKFGIEVIVWGRTTNLAKLQEEAWLTKVDVSLLNKSLPFRQYWRSFKLNSVLKNTCDIVVVPGSIYSSAFRPYIAICHNALPHSKTELDRYQFSWLKLKLQLTRYLQVNAFKNANGLIFCSNFTQNLILEQHNLQVTSKMIPTGIHATFNNAIKKQRSIKTYSETAPFNLLYVSRINEYKHQWILVEAVAQLRAEGFMVALKLIGQNDYQPSMDKLTAALKKHDPNGSYIEHIEFVPGLEAFAAYYAEADAFAFSSSCENMPNIVVEAMAAGLPIASSNYGPMPELLKDASIYYDPVSVSSTYKGLKDLLINEQKRSVIASKSQEYAKAYKWEKCADDTFKFILEVYNDFNKV